MLNTKKEKLNESTEKMEEKEEKEQNKVVKGFKHSIPSEVHLLCHICTSVQ